MIESAAELDFGARGNAAPYLRQGWSQPEAGFTWSIGTQASLHIPLAPAVEMAGRAHDLMLELDVTPFVVPGILPRQKLVLYVNGFPLDDTSIEGDGTLGWRLPPDFFGVKEMFLEMHHPEAACPADHGLNQDARRLGFMVRHLRVMRVAGELACAKRYLPPKPMPVPGGQPVRELMLNFESLGHNCEFGLVQRHCGAEPLGLLRFAGISLPDLLRGLDWEFDGIAAEKFVRAVEIDRGRPEFIIRNELYDLGLHTFRYADETTAEIVRQEQIGQLAFFHRKFLEVLRTGERIFVFQRPGQLTELQMLPLLTLLQSYGPNTLLCVTESAAYTPGSVWELRPGLLHGRIGTLAPADDPGAADLPAWLSIAANAYHLWQENRNRDDTR